MKRLVIGDLLSRAWELSVKHWPVFVCLTILSSLLSVIGMNVDPQILQEAMGSNDPALIATAMSEATQLSGWIVVGSLVSLYLSYISIRLYINVVRTGRPYTTVSDALSVDLVQMAHFIITSLVYAIILGFGLCLFILPGIFFGIRLYYAPYLVIAENLTIGKAISRSWQLTKGHFWSLLLIALVCIGIYIVGLCACCVGIFFAEVVVYFLLALTMFQLLHFNGNNSSPLEGNAEPLYTGAFLD